MNRPMLKSVPLPTQNTLKSSFLYDCIRIPLNQLTPLKAMRPSVKNSLKYQQILASVREIGLVEPPAVTAIPEKLDSYFILDGHLRIEALKDLQKEYVDCMIATDDDTYSYNKRINKLSAVQQHEMISRAMQRGVSAERLGKVLGLSPLTIKQKFRMLNGICDEAVNLLADTNCPNNVFEVLRKMKPLRQIETAEMMIGNRNFSTMLANAMLVATTPNMLCDDHQVAPSEPVSSESMARIERELSALQFQIKQAEESYGPDVLQLTIITGYLSRILMNATAVNWLAKNQPDYLREFQNITEITELPIND